MLDFNRFKFKDFSSGVTGDDDIDESFVFRGFKQDDAKNSDTLETKEEDAVTESSEKKGMQWKIISFYNIFMIIKPLLKDSKFFYLSCF